MFLSLRSPLGGRALAGNWLREIRRKQTLRLDTEKEARIVNDLWALKVGYCDSCGEEICVTESTAKFLFGMLYKRFKRPS